MKHIKGLNAFRNPTALVSVLLVVLSIVRIRTIEHGSLWGDDALLYRASQMPGGYASSFTESFFQTGSLKYRALLTPALSFLLDLFGNDQYWYLVVTTILVGLLAYTAFKIAMKIGGSPTVSVAISLLVYFSRFGWYSRENVFGVMEAGALVLVLTSVYLFLPKKTDEGSEDRLLISAVFALASATFVHERYLPLSFVFPIACLMTSAINKEFRSNRRVKISALFLAIPILHILLKSSLLRVSAFVGGGESDFSSVKGFWILKHFVKSMQSILGLSDGYDVMSERWGVDTLTPQALSILLTAFFVYVVAHCLIRLFNQRRTLSAEQSFRHLVFFILLGCLLSTSLSASLVIERIEFRWLYGPYIFLLLTLCYSIDIVAIKRLRHSFLIASAFLLVLAELFYSPLHDEHIKPREQVWAVISEVEKFSPDVEPWVLEVRTDNSPPWVWWQFGYGYVFTQLSNPPLKISLNEEGRPCEIAPIGCVILYFDGESGSANFRLPK